MKRCHRFDKWPPELFRSTNFYSLTPNFGYQKNKKKYCFGKIHTPPVEPAWRIPLTVSHPEGYTAVYISSLVTYLALRCVKFIHVTRKIQFLVCRKHTASKYSSVKQTLNHAVFRRWHRTFRTMWLVDFIHTQKAKNLKTKQSQNFSLLVLEIPNKKIQCMWKSAEFLKAMTRCYKNCSKKRALKGLAKLWYYRGQSSADFLSRVPQEIVV